MQPAKSNSNIKLAELESKIFSPCEQFKSSSPSMTEPQANEQLRKIPKWQLDLENRMISRVFKFANYDETIEFVNAVAYIAKRRNHHPELAVGYNSCQVMFTTYSVKGITINDFICANDLEALL